MDTGWTFVLSCDKTKRDVGMVPFMLLNNARNILLNNFLYNYILLTLDVAPEKVGKKFL